MKILIYISLLLLPASSMGRTVTRVTLAPGAIQGPAPQQMEGFSSNITPAQPPLPERRIKIALHPHVDLSSLKVQIVSGPVATLPGVHLLKANPPARRIVRGRSTLSWGRAGTVLAGQDLDAFGQFLFPRQVLVREGISNRRGLRVLTLRYTPLRYRHSTGELLLDRHTEAQVSYRLTRQIEMQPDPQLVPFLDRVDNAAEARRWYGGARAETAQKTGYAIVIPDRLRDASEKLGEFIQHKEELGMSVTVVHDADLAAVEIGEQEGDAERIRGWLQQNYLPLNLKYVLLIGNPDTRRAGVPMKMTHPLTHDLDGSPTPSDYYYADLTGNWDVDGDGDVAEHPDDIGEEGAGGVDFTPEVYVGRIPVYDDNFVVLDQILAKTMSYIRDRGDHAWRRRVLQPAAMLFFRDEYHDPVPRLDGSDIAEPIYESAIKPVGFTQTTLYEEYGIDPAKKKGDLPLTRENLVSEWQRGYGLVTMVGHGSNDAIWRHVWIFDDGNGVADYGEVEDAPFFTYNDVASLDDSRPSFVYHGSCSNGTPENAGNLGYGLLRNGAVGTISASRESLILFKTGNLAESSANIFGVERDFTHNLLRNKSVGESIYLAKEELSENLGRISWSIRLQLNLYGDPSLSLTNCEEDADCDDKNPCNGLETCAVGQCLAGAPTVCVAEDPCIEATCDSATGECRQQPRPEGELCDDHTFCTVNDICQGGVCGGEPRCAAPGNPCVEATCDEAGRTCDVFPINEGQLCHGDTPREGTCGVGICEPAPGGCALHQTGSKGRPSALILFFLLLLLCFRRGARRVRRLS